jgi:hypothetical protein
MVNSNMTTHKPNVHVESLNLGVALSCDTYKF